jgi:hypothetical protein
MRQSKPASVSVSEVSDHRQSIKPAGFMLSLGRIAIDVLPLAYVDFDNDLYVIPRQSLIHNS